MCLQYNLDSVSEFNGYYMVRCWHRNESLSIDFFAPSAPFTYFCDTGTFSDLASTPICYTTHIHLLKVISERFQSHFSEYALMVSK